MKTIRAVRHRDRGCVILNERKYFYSFSGWEKLSRGIMPNFPEQNALERIGITVDDVNIILKKRST